jgi:CDP-glucose 4,6-dehydratase
MVAAALPSREFWRGKRVLVTGHTGFKGGWLALWLSYLGAEVAGYALAPNTTPSLFAVCGVERFVRHKLADIRDPAALASYIAEVAPDIVFHMAAQPLVRESYAAPLETYSTNIMGTAFMLDAVARTPSVKATIIVTSDKVYAEGGTAHDESAPLGGHDPYSASKACAELVSASFPSGSPRATVRAGNVIGGGDWSADRLIPDFIRALCQDEALTLRNPHAIRPWQHVLDALCGYLLAAEQVWHGTATRAWNFGPATESEATVEDVAKGLCALWPGASYAIAPDARAPHEAAILRLDSTRAHQELHWQPRYNFAATLALTCQWYHAWRTGAGMTAVTLAQIEAYCHHD